MHSDRDPLIPHASRHRSVHARATWRRTRARACVLLRAARARGSSSSAGRVALPAWHLLPPKYIHLYRTLAGRTDVARVGVAVCLLSALPAWSSSLRRWGTWQSSKVYRMASASAGTRVEGDLQRWRDCWPIREIASSTSYLPVQQAFC